MPEHATARERFAVHQMYKVGLSAEIIADSFGWKHKRRVYSILNQPVTPRKRKGRPPLLDTPKRKRLVDMLDNEPGKYLRYKEFLYMVIDSV